MTTYLYEKTSGTRVEALCRNGKWLWLRYSDDGTPFSSPENLWTNVPPKPVEPRLGDIWASKVRRYRIVGVGDDRIVLIDNDAIEKWPGRIGEGVLVGDVPGILVIHPNPLPADFTFVQRAGD